jgi:NAD(P)-dependent dehydrogenase (short-subunit alcohol dehydrogenase family)
MSLFSLEGRRAIVTGGAKGLGFGMACGLAEAGAEVVALDSDSETLELAREQAAARGYDIAARRCDVSDLDAVAAAADELADHAGLVLVNNAGVGGVGPTVDVTREEWLRVHDVNLWGVFACAREFGRAMIAQGGGVIVNIASAYAALGCEGALYLKQPQDEPQECAAYNASKGGVLALTRALACSWARHGVRVNAISPGMMVTAQTRPLMNERVAARLAERTPLGRLGQPEDLVGAVVFLASDASAFVTGHNLAVDGGWTAW